MNIVFFVSAYNDIDAVAPIAYKLLQSKVATKIFIVNQSSSFNFDLDFRIQYLRKFGEIVYLEVADFLDNQGFVGFAEKIKKPLSTHRVGESAYNHLILPALKRNQEKAHARFSFDSLPLEPNVPTVFLFDYNTSVITSNGIKYARNKGIPVGLIPHGLRTIDHRGLLQHKRESRVIAGLDNYQQADILFANNENFSATFPSVDSEKVRFVGSARYCNEWSAILDQITPPVSLPEPDAGKIRMCVMLSKWQFDIWKSASMWNIKYLAAQDDFFTIVKPHTRGMDVRAELGNYDNLLIADDEAHSRRLIQWADVVLFWKSSIFMDALLLDKPLLHLHYATSFRLNCADFVTGWNVNSREDTMEWVQRFRTDRLTRTYSPKEREDCLDYFVNDAKGDVLQRHVDVVLEMLEWAAKW